MTRRAARVPLLVGVVLVLAACSGSGSPSPAASDGGGGGTTADDGAGRERTRSHGRRDRRTAAAGSGGGGARRLRGQGLRPHLARRDERRDRGRGDKQDEQPFVQGSGHCALLRRVAERCRSPPSRSSADPRPTPSVPWNIYKSDASLRCSIPVNGAEAIWYGNATRRSCSRTGTSAPSSCWHPRMATSRPPPVSLAPGVGRQDALTRAHKKRPLRAGARVVWSIFGVGCGGRIRTADLRVMSPTSCRCSTPRP